MSKDDVIMLTALCTQYTVSQVCKKVIELQSQHEPTDSATPNVTAYCKDQAGQILGRR